MRFKKLLHSLVVLPLALAAPVMAQTDTPLTLIVGFPPGGGVDSLARLLAQEISPQIGRTILVENRPGAGGTIAVDAAARSAADGNTLLFTETSSLIAPHVFPKVNYKLNEQFTPVGMLARSALVVAVPSNSPYQTLSDVLAAAKEKPGQLSYASSGVGSQHHLSGEWIKNKAGVDIAHVPYKGGAPSAQDLASGQIPLGVISLSSLRPHLEGGRARLLAVLTDTRYPDFPNVPTVSETLEGVNSTPSMFILAPKGTPEAMVQQFTQAMEKALKDNPKLNEAFAVHGSVAHYMPPEELKQWMQDEEARWVEVIQSSKLTFD